MVIVPWSYLCHKSQAQHEGTRLCHHKVAQRDIPPPTQIPQTPTYGHSELTYKWLVFRLLDRFCDYVQSNFAFAFESHIPQSRQQNVRVADSLTAGQMQGVARKLSSPSHSSFVRRKNRAIQSARPPGYQVVSAVKESATTLCCCPC